MEHEKVPDTFSLALFARLFARPMRPSRAGKPPSANLSLAERLASSEMEHSALIDRVFDDLGSIDI